MSKGSILVLSSKKDGQICMVDGKASKIRNGSTSPIKFTLFARFSQYAAYRGETYWKEIFDNASHDSFKKGYKFDGTVLSIKIKNSIKRLNISLVNQNDNDEFNNLYELTKHFFTETSGASCHLDDNSVFVQLPLEKTRDKGWSGNIPAKYQIPMVNHYVIEMTEKYQLSQTKSNDLKECLIAMIYSGDILSSEIHCVDSIIISIDRVQFIEGNFRILETQFKPNFSKKRKIVVPTNQLENSEILSQNVNNKYVFKCSKNLSAAGKHAPIYV